MHLAQHYVDRRLVALYDEANGSGDDHDFYRSLADELDAQRVLDLGCGTGLLTRTLVAEGRVVVGIDPAVSMLDYARVHTKAGQVEWILGAADRMPGDNADLVLMTGNVAQVFIDDDEWGRTLRHIHRSLRLGGTGAFESRNPEGHPWEQWTPEATAGLSQTPDGPLREWLDHVHAENGVVHLEGHNVFLQTGEHLVAPDVLRFRSRDEIVESLQVAGFELRSVFGDWRGSPLTRHSKVMIFVAETARTDDQASRPGASV